MQIWRCFLCFVRKPRFGHLSADNMFGIGYEAVKPEDIPNFLDESWAIKEEESTDGEE